MLFYPLLATFGHFFLQWLGVTRSDPPPPFLAVTRLSLCFFNILDVSMERDG